MIPAFRYSVYALVAAGLTACATSVPSPNLGLYKRELVEWHDSGSYERAFAASSKPAAAYLKQRIAQRKAGEKIAVVFDIDETLLSNWGYLTHRNFGITSPSFAEWVARHDDPALTPTRAIYEEARLAGLPIFLITGRSEALRVHTLRQLKAAGYTGWDRLYMKPLHYTDASIIPFKSAARREIEAQGYLVTLNMGDQWSDLKGGYAEKPVKLPNPYYFIR